MTTFPKRSLMAAMLILFVAVGVNAQDRYENASAYSALGSGFPVDYRSSQGSAMGISGVAISNRLSGNISNPALWSNTYFTLANGGISFTSYDAKDDFGSATNSNIGINHFQLQLPIYRDKMGVSIALFPVTESRFSALNVYSDDPSTPGADTLQYQSFFRGEGGLNRLEAGFGYELHENLSFGYAASLVFGVQRSATDVGFITSGYSPVSFDTRTSSIGFGNRFGLYSQFLTPFTSEDALALGLSISLPVNLSSSRESISVIGNQQIVLEDGSDNDGEIRLPLEVTGGVAYYFNRYLLVSGEVQYQNWSDYKNFSGQNEEFLTDRLKLGAGFEYSAFRHTETNLFTRFGYRAGFSYDSGHISLNDTQIQTMLVSAGLTIPSPASGSSVDINFDYGIRGTTSHELVRERIFAIRMSFNLSERMFFQRRLQ
ncbi:MAG: hypothetical protein LAT57_05175 [Balneolales bacterium]|nr:hypothetical protein [Balneolales bacterium]